jgi:hypothetical protein
MKASVLHRERDAALTKFDAFGRSSTSRIALRFISLQLPRAKLALTCAMKQSATQLIFHCESGSCQSIPGCFPTWIPTRRKDKTLVPRLYLHFEMTESGFTVFFLQNHKELSTHVRDIQ